MTIAVTIDIGGDVIIYEKNRVWNIVFITDKDHMVKVYNNGPTKPDIELADANRPTKLYFKPTGAATMTRSHGRGYDTILNLNDSDLHGSDAMGKSNLNEMPTPANGRQYVHLEIPIGVLGGESPAPDYWIAEYPGGVPAAHGHAVAKLARLTFSLNDGGRVAIHERDENGREVMSWAASKAGDIHLLFDNDCHLPGNRNDFLNYYDWVTDKSGFPPGTRKFIAGKLHSKFAKGAPLDEKMMGRDGNCDPVVIDPPPGP